MNVDVKLKPQAKAILAFLERWNQGWTCALQFSRHGFVGHDYGWWWVAAYSQRIGELRRAGYNIDSRRCQLHGHNVYEYRLVTA